MGGDAEREREVLGSLRPGDTLHTVPGEGVLEASGELSEAGWNLVDEASRADVTLFDCRFDSAPVLNVVTHALRDRLAGPSFALCSGGAAAEALAAGADGVLAVPFDAAELQARVLAHRRLVQVTVDAAQRGAETPWPRPGAAAVNGLTIDPSSLQAAFGDRQVLLTPREAGLLGYFVRNEGRVCSREELLDRVWGIRFDTGTNMVDVYVHFIRRRLEALACPYRIATVRGAGYRLESAGPEGPDRTITGSPSDSAR